MIASKIKDYFERHKSNTRKCQKKSKKLSNLLSYFSQEWQVFDNWKNPQSYLLLLKHGDKFYILFSKLFQWLEFWHFLDRNALLMNFVRPGFHSHNGKGWYIHNCFVSQRLWKFKKKEYLRDLSYILSDISTILGILVISGGFSRYYQYQKLVIHSITRANLYIIENFMKNNTTAPKFIPK